MISSRSRQDFSHVDEHLDTYFNRPASIMLEIVAPGLKLCLHFAINVGRYSLIAMSPVIILMARDRVAVISSI